MLPVLSCQRVGVEGVGVGGVPVVHRPLFSKWNDPVFCSTMTAEHFVDYSATGAKTW